MCWLFGIICSKFRKYGRRSVRVVRDLIIGPGIPAPPYVNFNFG